MGVAAACLVVAAAGVAVAFVQFGEFDRVDFDPGSARQQLEQYQLEREGVVPEGARLDGDLEDEDNAEIERGDEMLTTLALGSDAPDGHSSRADAILLVILPPGDAEPVIASIPRDLWVHNPCTGEMSRINEGLEGCGEEISGPELMTVMVEDLGGIEIDHFAQVDFEGFVRIIDAFGGVEICTEHPVRDEKAELSLPGGCVDADGDDALAWARSRRTHELVDGTWQPLPGVNALARDERHQDLVLQVAEQVAGFGSIGELRALVNGLQDSVTLDARISLQEAVGLAWAYRDLDIDEAKRVSIPVYDDTTPGGAAVVRARVPLRELLAEALGRDPAELADHP